jgi:hypothetical protein
MPVKFPDRRMLVSTGECSVLRKPDSWRSDSGATSLACELKTGECRFKFQLIDKLFQKSKKS